MIGAGVICHALRFRRYVFFFVCAPVDVLLYFKMLSDSFTARSGCHRRPPDSAAVHPGQLDAGRRAGLLQPSKSTPVFVGNGAAGTFVKLEDDKIVVNLTMAGKQGLFYLNRVDVETQSGNIFVRRQFPIMLAWATNIHKVQGMQFDQLQVDFELGLRDGANEFYEGHGKQTYYCKQCGGTGICEHGNPKYCCKECKGHSRGVRRGCPPCRTSGLLRRRPQCCCRRRGTTPPPQPAWVDSP